MRERIELGDWQVGQRLPTEPELALQLGISRNTVREAMRVLAFSGLVEIRQWRRQLPAHGPDPLQAVQAMSRCTHEQARETRHILEAEAIGLAALRRTDADLQALRDAPPAVPDIFTVISMPMWPATWCFTSGWSMPPITRP